MSLTATPGTGFTFAVDVIGAASAPAAGQGLSYAKFDLGAAGASQPVVGSLPVAQDTGVVWLNGVALTPKFVVINTSASTTLVAAVTSKRLRVLAGMLSAAGAVSVKFQSHVTPTDLTGPIGFGAQSSIPIPYCPVGNFQTVAGEALDINLSAAVAVGGWLVYVEV